MAPVTLVQIIVEVPALKVRLVLSAALNAPVVDSDNVLLPRLRVLTVVALEIRDVAVIL